MNKEELIKRAAARCGVSQKQMKGTVDAVLGVIGSELADGGTVVLPDFGKFQVVTRKERRMRPLGRDYIVVPSTTKVRFKAYANIHLYSAKY